MCEFISRAVTLNSDTLIQCQNLWSFFCHFLMSILMSPVSPDRPASSIIVKALQSPAVKRHFYFPPCDISRRENIVCKNT